MSYKHKRYSKESNFSLFTRDFQFSKRNNAGHKNGCHGNIRVNEN